MRVLKRTILATVDGKAGCLSLNRGKVLHALNYDMCVEMIAQLLEWADDDRVEFVLIDHLENTRGFCAGGDVKMLVESGMHKDERGPQFFEAEYRLNDLIAHYPKPVVAVMDGITMGGGVGLAVHASHRIATDRTVFAMPETGIGLIPDVGGTWFLPRLRGEFGTWLALTGARIKGLDVLASGLATHYCDHNDVRTVKDGLKSLGLSALSDLETRAAYSRPEQPSQIDHLFQGDCLKKILQRLSAGSDWAREQGTRLAAKSPLSCKIALRQMRTGPYLGSLRDALKLEFRIVTRLIQTRNFHEGVRATLIDVDHCPLWEPRTLYTTSYDDVARFFTPLGDDKELTFLEY